jgi:hypothetical protein
MKQSHTKHTGLLLSLLLEIPLFLTTSALAAKPTNPLPDPDEITIRLGGGYVENMGFIPAGDQGEEFTNDTVRHMAVSIGQLGGVNPETGQIIFNEENLLPLVAQELDVTGNAFFYTNSFFGGNTYIYGVIYGSGAGITNVPADSIYGSLAVRPEIQAALNTKADHSAVWDAVNQNIVDIIEMQQMVAMLTQISADTNNPHQVTAHQTGAYTIQDAGNLMSNFFTQIDVGEYIITNMMGDVTIAGSLTASNVTADSFVGDGSGLTNITTANLTGSIIKKIQDLSEEMEGALDTKLDADSGWAAINANTVDIEDIKHNGASDHSEIWTIAVIPDIQHLVAEPVTNPNSTHILKDMFKWVVDNRYIENIKMTIQLGDLTHHNGTGFRVQTPVDVEYERAKYAVDIIDDAGMPILLVAGNHEYDYVLHPITLVGFNNYFPDIRFLDKEWYGGQYETNNAQNVYYQIDVCGQKYVFIATSFEPDDDILNWCNAVVSNNSDAIVIYSTHYYLAKSSADGNGVRPSTGAQQWETFIRNHRNISVVLSGHVGQGSSVLSSLTDRLSICTQFSHDYSNEAINDWILLLKVSPITQTISSRMYSPSTDSFLDEYPARMEFPLLSQYSGLETLFLIENGKITGFK